MSLIRHPVTDKINNVSAYLKQDMRVINDEQSIGELQRKLDAVQSVDEQLRYKLQVANQSSQKNKFTIYQLEKSLDENEILKRTLERSIIRLGGSVSDRAGLNSRIEDHADNIARLERLLEEKESEAKQEISTLTNRIAQLSENKISLESQISRLESTIESLNRLNQELNGRQPKLVTQIQEAERKLQELRSEFDIEKQKLNVDKFNLEKELTRTRENLVELRQSLSGNDTRIAELASEKDKCSQQLVSKQTELDELQNALSSSIANKEREIEELTRGIQEVQQRFQSESRQKSDLEVRVATLDAQLANLQAKDVSLQQQLASSSSGQTTLQIELQKAREELDQLQSDLQLSTAKVSEKDNSIMVLQEKVDELQTNGIRLGREIAELTGSVDSLRQERETTMGEKDNLTQLLETTRKQLEELTTASLSSDEQNQMAVSQLRTNLADKDRQLSEALSSIQELRAQNGQLSDDSQQLASEITTLQKQISDLNLEKDSSVQQYNTLRQEFDQTMQELTSTRDQLQQKKDEVAARELDIQVSQTKVENLTRELQQKVADLSVSVAEQDRLKQQIQNLKSSQTGVEKEREQTAQELETSNQEILKLQEILSKKDQEVVQLQSDLTSKTNLISEQETELQRLASRLTELEQKSLEEQETRTKIEQQITATEREVEKLKEELSSTQAQLEVQKGLTMVKEEQIKSLELDLVSKTNEIRELTDKISLMTADSTVASGQLQSSEAELERLKVESMDMKRKLEELKQNKSVSDEEHKQNVEKFNMEIDKLKNDLQAKEQEVDTERSKFEAAKEEIQTMLDLNKREKEQFKQLIETLKSSENASRITIEQIRRDIEEKDEQIKRLKTETEQMVELNKSATESMQKSIDECTEANRKLESDIQKEIEEKKELTDRLTDSSRTLDEAQNIQRDFDEFKVQKQNELSAISEQNQLLAREKEKLDRKVQELNQNVESITSQYRQLSTRLATEEQKRQEEESRRQRQQEIEEEKRREVEEERRREELQRQEDARIQQQLEEEKRREEELAELAKQSAAQMKLLELSDELMTKSEEGMNEIYLLYGQIIRSTIRPVEKVIIKKQAIEEIYPQSDIKKYILTCLNLFYLWKNLVRLPVIMRSLDNASSDSLSSTVKNYFSYQVPVAGTNTNNFLLIKLGSDEVRQSYKNKTTGGKMRIDVLFYFMIVALIGMRDDPDSVENNDLLKYITELISSTVLNLNSIIDDIKKYNANKASVIRSEHNQDSKILTFVRLTSTTPNDINKRFEVDIDEEKILSVKYDDTPVKFYNITRQGDATIVEETEQKVDYSSQYWFGPFTGVFRPEIDNADILKKSVFKNTIENRLRLGEPICIIGYGASGSGKTTTLIYADYKTVEQGRTVQVKKPGILVLLANELAKPPQIQNALTYTRCKVSIYEFEGDRNSTGNDIQTKFICRKFPAKPNSTKTVRRVVRAGDGFSDNVVQYENCDSDMELSFEYKIELDQKNAPKWVNNSGEEMQKCLLDYINVYRNIAPSPNNPQSSRSHVVCILTFVTDDNRTCSLVVCDFAGVENQFDCTNQVVLDNMGIPKLIEVEKETIIGRGIMTEQESVNIEAEKLEDEEIEQIVNANYMDNGLLFNNLIYQSCNKVYEYVRNTLYSSLGLKGKLQEKELVKTWLKEPSEVPPEYYNRFVEDKKTKTTKVSISASASASNMDIDETNMTYLAKKFKKINNPPYIAASEVPYLILDHINWQKITISAAPDEFYSRERKNRAPLEPFATIFKNVEDNRAYKTGYNYLLANYIKKFPEEGKKFTQANKVHQLIKILCWYRDAFDPYAAFYSSMITLSVTPRGIIPTEILPLAEVEQRFKSVICSIRSKEGVFINNSLYQLRQFIGYTLKQSSSTGYAPFIDQCAPIQCNPYFRDCFGQNEYYDKNIQKVSDKASMMAKFGPLSRQIDRAGNNMTFCIFTVVNLSKTANNPPPTPYIDISDIIIEQEKLKLLFADFNTSKIAKLVEPSFYESDSSLIDVSIFERFKANPLLNYIDETTRNKIISLISDIMRNKNVYSTLTDRLIMLIETVTDYNAISTIGTLEFTDMMAKYATNKVICSKRLSERQSYSFEEEKQPASQGPSGTGIRSSSQSPITVNQPRLGPGGSSNRPSSPRPSVAGQSGPSGRSTSPRVGGPRPSF